MGVLQAHPGRVLWRCRRGMKELDVMLERFARGALVQAPEQERALFEELLALPDPLLASYLLDGEVPPEARLAGLVARIRDLCRLGGVPAVF
ncbi:MAG: succinate dehydrogenase assembly factor 2 [Steroidobacteraceae bacterium]